MERITVFGDNIVPQRDIALNLIECRKDNPAYDQLQGLFLEEKSKVSRLIKPMGVFAIARSGEDSVADYSKDFTVDLDHDSFVDAECDSLVDTECDSLVDTGCDSLVDTGHDSLVDSGICFGDKLYVLLSLGSDISSYIDECTKSDLMRGLLVGFMADSCLLAFEEQMNQHIKEYLGKLGCGVSRILEPFKHIPGQYQKIICDKLYACNTLGVSLTSGYMLSPIKSMSKVYVLSRDADEFNTSHDCNNCMGCPLKRMN